MTKEVDAKKRFKGRWREGIVENAKRETTRFHYHSAGKIRVNHGSCSKQVSALYEDYSGRSCRPSNLAKNLQC